MDFNNSRNANLSLSLRTAFLRVSSSSLDNTSSKMDSVVMQTLSSLPKRKSFCSCNCCLFNRVSPHVGGRVSRVPDSLAGLLIRKAELCENGIVLLPAEVGYASYCK